MFSGEYTSDWKEIAEAAKAEVGWRCVRCGHPGERPGQRIRCDGKCDASRHPGGLDDGKQRVLTIHHLTGQKDLNVWWNLAPLCQVCHLVIQGKVVLERRYMFEHSEWFKPYVAGWYAHKYLGLNLSRAEVMERLDDLLSLERVL